jgi:hypothetical protein
MTIKNKNKITIIKIKIIDDVKIMSKTNKTNKKKNQTKKGEKEEMKRNEEK